MTRHLMADGRPATIHIEVDRAGGQVPKVETNTRRIVARLEAEGWRNIGGGGHDRYVNADRAAEMIVVPRHRELTAGVARSIAKAAGWI